MDVVGNKLSFDFQTTSKIIKKLTFIDYFNGSWDAGCNHEKKQFQGLKRKVNSDLLHTMVNFGRKNENIASTATSKNELNYLFQKFSKTIDYSSTWELPLREEYLKELHKIIVFDENQENAGNYKSTLSKPFVFYPSGVSGMMFRSTSAHLVQHEINGLLKWINHYILSKELHPLLVIPALVYEFIAIHPFETGNYEIAWVFPRYLMKKTGYNFIDYVPLEKLFRFRINDYYKALFEGHKNRYSGNEKIEIWVELFLDLLIEGIDELRKVSIQTAKEGPYLNDRQKRIKSIINKKQPVKIGDLEKQMKGLSRNTLKKDLLYMKKENVIHSDGKNKGVVYYIKN